MHHSIRPTNSISRRLLILFIAHNGPHREDDDSLHEPITNVVHFGLHKRSATLCEFWSNPDRCVEPHGLAVSALSPS